MHNKHSLHNFCYSSSCWTGLFHGKRHMRVVRSSHSRLWIRQRARMTRSTVFHSRVWSLGRHPTTIAPSGQRTTLENQVTKRPCAPQAMNCKTVVAGNLQGWGFGHNSWKLQLEISTTSTKQ
eukprot:5445462-Amphidinium_carterae.1